MPEFIIQPKKISLLDNLKELWKFRELIYFLVWRDIKVRYKQTFVGVFWVVLQPVAMVIIFTLFFGRLAGIDTGSVPYPLYALAGIIPWQIFSKSISDSTTSLVTDQKLITRIYFPRLIIPISNSLSNLIDFAITIGILMVMMVWYGFYPTKNILWIPLFICLIMAAINGVGLWLSALNVEYRDVRYALPFVNQIWFFLSPVVYPSTIVPEKWKFLYNLNPMVGIMDGFRWCFLSTEQELTSQLIIAVIVSIFLLITGYLWFLSRESKFADTLGTGGQ